MKKDFVKLVIVLALIALVFPVVAQALVWPVSGRITSVFGYRGYPTTFHYGTDIACYYTYVGNAGKGKVSIASYGWNGGWGNMIRIYHGNALYTQYGHLSKIYVRRGQSLSVVNKNIAKSGNSGLSTGPHLDLKIMKNGSWRRIPVSKGTYVRRGRNIPGWS